LRTHLKNNPPHSFDDCVRRIELYPVSCIRDHYILSANGKRGIVLVFRLGLRGG
jgi:hypothetical protein